MKRLITIIFGVALFACSNSGEDPKPKLVPSNLYQRHITNFYSEANKRGKNPIQITPEVRFTDNKEFDQSCGGGEEPLKRSVSYKSGDKYIIEVSDKLESSGNDLGLMTIFYREMAHLTIDKPYSEQTSVPTGGVYIPNIMYRCSNVEQITTSQDNINKAVDYLFQ